MPNFAQKPDTRIVILSHNPGKNFLFYSKNPYRVLDGNRVDLPKHLCDVIDFQMDVVQDHLGL